jgi:UbiD family decarboxylase
MVQDLRSYLEVLRKSNLLMEVDSEVDPLRNLAGVAYRAENEQGKATMFHSLKGFPGWRAVSYMCGSREKMALGLGMEKSGVLQQLGERIGREQVKPIVVDDGPVKEVVLKGDEADLTKIPIHTHSSSDLGVPFIGSGMQTIKDPETGVQNVALQRNHIKGKNKMCICSYPGRHTDMITKKYWKMNKATPIAVVVGHHPAYYIGSTWTTGFGVDEVEITGALLQESVERVRCETSDILVPAHAEIVIEGEIPPNYMEDEGPFGEHAGASMGVSKQPVINVKAITMRKDAIYYALQGARPIAESQPLDAFPMEFVIYNRIKDVGGFSDIRDVVALPYAGGCHILVIQMVPRKEGEVKSVLLAALTSPYQHPKIAIAVDEDVNPHDPKAIWWSISTRFNPLKDITIVRDTMGFAGDTSLELLPDYGEGGFPSRRGSMVIIDATKGPSRWPAEMRDIYNMVIPTGYDEVKLEDLITR